MTNGGRCHISRTSYGDDPYIAQMVEVGDGEVALELELLFFYYKFSNVMRGRSHRQKNWREAENLVCRCLGIKLFVIESDSFLTR